MEDKVIVFENEEEVLRQCSEPDEDDEDEPEQMEEIEVPLNIVPREEWGALPAKSRTTLPHPVPNVLFIYSNTDPCLTRDECTKFLQDLQKRQMEEEGMPDIQYNYYIAADLTVYEGRGWHATSTQPHADYAEVENKIFDICYLGHYEGEPYPSIPVLQVRDELLRLGIDKGYIHEDFNNFPTVV